MRIPTNQFVLGVVSVVLSMLLWFWVSAQERSEIVVSVPLQYRNLPRGYEILPEKELVATVNIWVKGTTATIRNLRPQEISAWVELQNTKPGQRSFELAPDQVHVPYGFSVLRISPSRINLAIEQAASRMVPVTVRLEGEPRLGYTVTETMVVPPFVEIHGPQSAVASVRHVITDSIDVSSITGNYVETVNIGAENSAIRLGGTKTVRVTLTVSEISDVATLRRIPVTVIGANSDGVRFSPKWVRVDILGPKTLLTQISEKDITAVVDVTNLKAGAYELTPRIQVEPRVEKEVSVKIIVPERIHVRIL